MNDAQKTALQFHCRLASETLHPRFARVRVDAVAKGTPYCESPTRAKSSSSSSSEGKADRN